MTEEIQRTGRGANLYNDAMLAKMRTYLDVWEDRGPKRVIPTIEDLAKFLDVGRQTLYDWSKAHKEVGDELDRIMEVQADILIQRGLVKEFDNKLTALMLSKHGYIQEKTVDHKSSDQSMSPTRIEIVAPSDDDKAD